MNCRALSLRQQITNQQVYFSSLVFYFLFVLCGSAKCDFVFVFCFTIIILQ